MRRADTTVICDVCQYQSYTTSELTTGKLKYRCCEWFDENNMFLWILVNGQDICPSCQAIVNRAADLFTLPEMRQQSGMALDGQQAA